MTKIFESDIENFAIELLEKQGYVYLSPEEQKIERQNLSPARPRRGSRGETK